MESNDWGLTILIILIFILLYMFNVLAVGLQNIKSSWPQYRCNPMVMPFAGILGPEGTKGGENFTYCIQTMQKDYMQYLLQPVNYNLNVMGTTANTLTTSLNNVRAFFNNLRNMITSVIQNVFGVFLNIIIEFQRVTINIKDLFGKTVAIVAALLYTLSGSIMTMESAWKGPMGKMVRTLGKGFCFKPDTLLQTKSGKFVKMEDIELGETLKNGSIVMANMKIHNLDEEGKRIQNFYKLPGGEEGNDIYVTGEHLVYDEITRKFQNVNENVNSETTDVSSDYFSCLITSDHVILIGDKVFHDWEDNNGSSSKDV
jgi:hypothetical protein